MVNTITFYLQYFTKKNHQYVLAIHNAMGFQKMVVNLKEQLDSLVLDSCATTSLSFAVSDNYL
jgi:penicillin-binding protein-related factor A (putative recombinase)